MKGRNFEIKIRMMKHERKGDYRKTSIRRIRWKEMRGRQDTSDEKKMRKKEKEK